MKALKFTAFDFQELSGQQPTSPQGRNWQQKPAPLVATLTRGQVNQSPYLKRLTDRVQEYQMRAAVATRTPVGGKKPSGMNQGVT